MTNVICRRESVNNTKALGINHEEDFIFDMLAPCMQSYYTPQWGMPYSLRIIDVQNVPFRVKYIFDIYQDIAVLLTKFESINHVLKLEVLSTIKLGHRFLFFEYEVYVVPLKLSFAY
ncbi:UNVERIFIED_CONTAM: hypothetical protein NCL1_34348 [Trichonephila clavipes]